MRFETPTVTEATRLNVPTNVLKEEGGVTMRQVRIRTPGRSRIALKWNVENDRTGATRTFDCALQARIFFERQTGKNVFGRKYQALKQELMRCGLCP